MPTFEEHIKNIFPKVNITALEALKTKYPNLGHKYLNYSFELPYKLTFATKYLYLEFLQPKDILDIGTGPGWFPMIAKHFNHKITCCDVSSVCDDLKMFEDVLHIFGLKKDFTFSVEPQKKIPSEIGKYDIITALGMALHHGWKLKDWYFFLDDLIDNHCKSNTNCTIYFQVNRNQAWEILEADRSYQTRIEIKTWEMFESHMLRITLIK